MTDVRRERIPWFCNTVGKTVLAKGFCFNMGIRSVCVSAEELICLEGVYTVRRSQK